jgi:hypothetical protein
MVDTLALGASAAKRGGSSPLPGTKLSDYCRKRSEPIAVQVL